MVGELARRRRRLLPECVCALEEATVVGLPPLGEDASLSLQVARVGWIFALVQRRAKGHPSRFVVARHRLVPDQLSLLLLQLVI